MKTLVLTGNKQLLTGLRMAGFEGKYCEDEETLRKEYAEAKKNPEIGIVVLSQREVDLLTEEGKSPFTANTLPLIVAIPEDMSAEGNFLLRHAQEAIGITMEGE